MAKKDVVNLLVKLFGDPDHLKKLKSDPDAIMSAAGLSADEQKLLRSRQDAKIKAYLGADSALSNIKTKSGLSNIKSKTAIKTKATAIKTKAKITTSDVSNIKTKFKK